MIVCNPAQVYTAVRRMQVGAEQAGAEAGRRDLRQAVGCCFGRIKLARLDPKQMQSMLQALRIDTGSPWGKVFTSELRLHYFAATTVWI